MPVVILTVLVVLVLVPDLYIALFMIRDANTVLKCLHWVPTALIVLMTVLTFAGFSKISRQAVMTVMFGLLLIFSLPKFFFMLFSLLGKLCALAWSPAAVGGNRLGLGLAAVVFFAVLYGFFFGWRRLVVNERQVEIAGLPAAFDGYRVAHLSDLHLGTYEFYRKGLERVVQTVNGLEPDVVVFTGDIVNAHPSETDGFVEELSRLKAKDGVFSVMGNHDYCEYYPFESAGQRAEAVEEVKNREREAGWTLLLDENRLIRRGSDSLAIVGVENISKPPFPSYGNLQKAKEGLSEGCFKILLSHDPSHWRLGVLPDSDVQLTLSGHTHAMHLRIGRFSPAKFMYPEWGGLYYASDGVVSTEPLGPVDRVLHVSAGTSGNVPFRLGAWPEVVVLTLRSKGAGHD